MTVAAKVYAERYSLQSTLGEGNIEGKKTV